MSKVPSRKPFIHFFSLSILLSLLSPFSNTLFSQIIVLPPDYIKSVQITSSEGNGFVPVIQKNGQIQLTLTIYKPMKKTIITSSNIVTLGEKTPIYYLPSTFEAMTKNKSEIMKILLIHFNSTPIIA
jgi:hypothetical protein